MKKAKAVINIYFDVVSPYSYIGVESFVRYQKHLPAQVNFYPFFLGYTITKAGATPPHANPQKHAYMEKDLQYASNYWGIPVKWPKDFKKRIIMEGSVKPQRFLTALQQENPEAMIPAAREFAARVWARDQPIFETKHILEVCEKLSIRNADKLLEVSNAENIRNLYRHRTNEAINSGAFGAPWIVLKQDGKTDRPFFGSDRLPFICNELGVKFKGSLKE